MTPMYRVATKNDCESITELVNISYSGEQSKQGWTNENGLVAGPRTTIEKVLQLISTDEQVILIFFDEVNGTLLGCIGIEHKVDTHIACLHTFAVRPDLQARGHGKLILGTAEKYAQDRWHVKAIEIGVLVQRSELVTFYTRRGYIDTGLRDKIISGESKSDRTTCCALERCIMMKQFNES